MLFEMVDRIHELVPARSIQASKVTSLAEEYWDRTTTPPRMPPVLVLESLCQAGAWLVNASTEGRSRAALGSIGVFEVEGEVGPGAVLDIRGEIDSLDEESAVLSGAVSCGGRPVLRARDIICVLLPAQKLEDPELTARRLRRLRGHED